MNRTIATALAAISVAHGGAADAQRYFARQRLTVVATPAASTPKALTCAPGDPMAWVYPASSGPSLFSDYRKVGSAPDRSPALQTICADAIRDSTRTQCFVYGQGGFNVDVYVSIKDGDLPYKTIERDNAIVYERLACTR